MLKQKLKKIYRQAKRMGVYTLYGNAILKEEYDAQWLTSKWHDSDPNMVINRGDSWLKPDTMVDCSLIIPVYNCERCLTELLEEIANQKTQYSFETILVDDGSKDGSAVICDMFEKRYPHIFKVFHQKNAGISAARNAGISASTGKYIGFIDDDDHISNQYVEKIMSTAYLHDADIVKSAYRNCNDSGDMLLVSNKRNLISHRNSNRIDNILSYNYLWGGIQETPFPKFAVASRLVV